ncbi:FMN-binding protein [Arenibacter sp. BSSL-BM3]|uniref:FMN-binding protein n=1 Tax=Arenibacter arenosicollis TaxID=2762274 RepID=A0ABR7QTE6_9FLAO|nr:FMN-binding protein [Arenibacter arenosicollis]MBC8770473.1 FMN-binding protein [Arenibacter arenosicollis]
MMKIKILLMILVVMGWNCKENPKQTEQKIEAVKEVIQTTTVIPDSIEEIATFVAPILAGTTNILGLIIFKELNTSGKVSTIEMARAGDLYNKLESRGQATSLPIFEIRDTDLVVLPIQGVGFGGAIWAKVLLDKKKLEIKKIAFEHKAESEGYGAAVSEKTFEDQFLGVKIKLDKDTFTLQKAGDAVHFIDGISGATMTSKGAVTMVNEGLRKYSSYLTGN